MYRKGNQYL